MVEVVLTPGNFGGMCEMPGVAPLRSVGLAPITAAQLKNSAARTVIPRVFIGRAGIDAVDEVARLIDVKIGSLRAQQYLSVGPSKTSAPNRIPCNATGTDKRTCGIEGSRTND